MSKDRLEELRRGIRALDHELIALLGKRRDLVLEVGAVKEKLGLPVLDPSQEAKVVRRATEIARDVGVDEELTRDIVWRIIESARNAQEGRTRWGPSLSQKQEKGPAT
jgi:chorismate mutase/prephenate dehydratase